MKRSGQVLVDTNILIHAYEKPRTPKSDIARRLIRELWNEQRGVVTLQNLCEFSSVCLTKLRPPLPLDDILTLLGDFRRAFKILAPGESTLETALLGVKTHGLSFWDAMIWAAAKNGGVEEILTEDFQSGREVEGVLFTNPY
ncbi:MAG: PIN domain-containing protein [Planctomycetes bacterium]|nr:PIN domain-containing protein [Planctomycetota bacterium]